MKTNRSQKGFSLLEVMVAMVILGGALLVLLNMGMVALDANDWSNKTTIATQAMQRKLESFRSDQSLLVSGSDSVSGVYLQWDITDAGSFLKQARIVASWENIKGLTDNSMLTAYIRTDST